jgi:aromatic ring-opening dioxygenase catalytic subunit (LigB family)
MNMHTVLHGHISPETAYVVDDYPYGHQLRCKIRYWIEEKKGYGQRFCSQTTNPKISEEVWNKPKHGVYHEMVIMYLDEKTRYIQNSSLNSFCDGRKDFEEFDKRFGHDLDLVQRILRDQLERISRRINNWE